MELTPVSGSPRRDSWPGIQRVRDGAGDATAGSNNTTLHAILALPMVRYEALGLASTCNIDLYGNCSAVCIKTAIWCSFISRIVF